MVKQSLLQRITQALRLQEPSIEPPNPLYYPETVSPRANMPKRMTSDDVVPLNFLPLGSAGTTSYAGYPSEDYLSQMRGKQRADIFDEMRRSDTQIQMCLAGVMNPILSAEWDIEPVCIDGVTTDEQAQDAELIKKILFKDLDWNAFLTEALSMYTFGHSVFERIHQVYQDDPEFGTYLGLRALSFRSQRTIERWNLDWATGDLVSITQYAFGDLNRQVNIPAENLLVYSLKKEGSNFEGISALRACYGPWFRKDNYLKLNAIGVEKFAIPTPMVEVPDGTKTNSPQYTNMINVLESYLTHQKNYLTYPTGWKILLEKNVYDPEKVEVSIDNEDKRIAKNFLLNFLELGGGGTGSYALSNDLSDFFLSGLEHVACQIATPINRNLIPELIRFNYGKRIDGYPVLKHCGISDKAGKELAETLQALAGSKVIVPDDQLEASIRKRYHLPKASLEGQRASPQGAPTPPPPPMEMDPSQSLAERIRLAEARRKKIEDPA